MVTPIITQRLLRQYQELVRKERGVEEARRRLRSYLIGLIRRGARVEGGPLHYQLQQITRTPLTKDAILSSLGWDAYETLITDITPIVSDRFVIVGATMPVSLPNNSESNGK